VYYGFTLPYTQSIRYRYGTLCAVSLHVRQDIRFKAPCSMFLTTVF